MTGKVAIKLENSLGIRENMLLAQHAESRGLASIWVSELRRDAFVLMAALAAGTERIRIGSAIVPIYTRSPAVLAMSAAALAELAPGRVILGLGSSTPTVVERWHGTARESPLTALRENVEVIRALLGGTRVHYAGEVVSVDGFQLGAPLAAPMPPIYMAALSRQALRLTARVADGVLVNLAPAHYLPSMRLAVDQAASSAPGRHRIELAGDVPVAIGDPKSVSNLRVQLRGTIASYGGIGVYNRFFAEAGFARQARAINAGWQVKDRERAIAAVDDEMLDALAAAGDGGLVQERLAAFLHAGMDEVIVAPVAAASNEVDAIRRTIDVVAELIAPPAGETESSESAGL